jgi:hypothetical protein
MFDKLALTLTKESKYLAKAANSMTENTMGTAEDFAGSSVGK